MALKQEFAKYDAVSRELTNDYSHQKGYLCGEIISGNKKPTDSFVVTPLFFKGGDIGRLAVCGTVNDLLMRGAVPKYITSAFIIEEGADTDTLEAIASSMAKTANTVKMPR